MILPVFGNLSIETGDKAVTLELRTFHEGRPYAVFTYREIKELAATLARLEPPASTRQTFDPDIEDLL